MDTTGRAAVETIASLFAAFEADPYATAACQVRRWDDQAKHPDAAVPPFEHFAPLLAALAR